MSKILIAEDDPLLSSILCSKFQSSGFEVMGTLDGEETVIKTKSWNPDFILLDILMPKKDGFQVLEELRAIFTYANIPVLVLSNVAEQTGMDRAKKLGVIGYLVKANTTPNDIVEQVQGLLKK
jgi:DNA-binding response OmpR family regulator